MARPTACGTATHPGIVRVGQNLPKGLAQHFANEPFQRGHMTPVNSPAIKIVKSVRDQVSPEEWQTRVDLAACYRLTAMYGMTEMIANHISCRVPGSHDQFLINPYGMLYEEIDASCLIKVDLEGNTLFNASDYGVNAAGFVIHSAIHMAKPEMECVAHTHTPAGMAVSAMECGLLPLAQTSMRFLHLSLIHISEPTRPY